MDPGGRSSEPCRVWSATVDPKERFMRQAWRKQASEGPLWPNATLICSKGFLYLRVGGSTITAVAHRTACHAASHTIENAGAAKLFTG